MTTLARLPFAPIPSCEVPDDSASRYFLIRPLALTFWSRHGERDYFETDRSNVAFARLIAAARTRETIIHLSQDGLDADHDSVAALNSYLRTARVGRMGLPWHRANAGLDRYAWADFCRHLELNFR